MKNRIKGLTDLINNGSVHYDTSLRARHLICDFLEEAKLTVEIPAYVIGIDAVVMDIEEIGVGSVQIPCQISVRYEVGTKENSLDVARVHGGLHVRGYADESPISVELHELIDGLNFSSVMGIDPQGEIVDLLCQRLTLFLRGRIAREAARIRAEAPVEV